MVRSLLLAGIGFLGIASAQSGADLSLLYRQAVDKQRQGDLAGAAELYKEVLRQDQGNIAARSNLGAALVGEGRFDEAIPQYESALRTAPDQVRARLQRNLALAYYKSGRMQQAADLLMSLHAAQPEDRDTTLLAADCLLQLGENAKVLALLEPLTGQAETEKTLAYIIGMAYLRSGRTEEAQRLLDPILKDSNSAEGNFAAGMAMFQSGNYPAAAKALARALEINPALPHALSFYGQALLFSGDPDGALVQFRRQLAMDRNDYEANLQSAAILAKRGNYSEAEPLLRRAVMLRPGSPEARFSLALTLTGEKKREAAQGELEAIVRQWPDFGAAHDRLAEIYAGVGRNVEAVKERAAAAKNAVTPPTTSGPGAGTTAPVLNLSRSEGGGTVKINGPVPGKPTVLVFGSYSCPNFRTAAPALNEMSKLYAGKISFLLVYIREAHATDQWQSTINEREKIQLSPAASEGQKHEYAVMCERKLHLRFPSAVDGLDNAAEKAYSAWPSKVLVISAAGRIRYSSGLTEQEFDRTALDKAVHSVIR